MGAPDRKFNFSLFRNIYKYIVFGEMQRVSVNPGPMLLLDDWPGTALIAVCSSVIYRNYTNGDDATTVVVLFCGQFHLGYTDMDLQHNLD